MVYFLLAILGVGLIFLAVGFYDWFSSEVPSMIALSLGLICFCCSICFPVFSYIDNCKTTYKVEKVIEFYNTNVEEVWYKIVLNEEDGTSFSLYTDSTARAEVFENKDYVELSSSEISYYYNSKKVKRAFEITL